jgi:hypothetical protein
MGHPHSTIHHLALERHYPFSRKISVDFSLAGRRPEGHPAKENGFATLPFFPTDSILRGNRGPLRV